MSLAAPCLLFDFEGPWRPDGAGMVMVDGLVRRGAAPAEGARLRLQFPDLPERSSQVTLSLTGLQGQSLLGPLTLRLQANDALTVGACTVR